MIPLIIFRYTTDYSVLMNFVAANHGYLLAKRNDRGCGLILPLSPLPQCKATTEWVDIISWRTEKNEIKFFLFLMCFRLSFFLSLIKYSIFYHKN